MHIAHAQPGTQCGRQHDRFTGDSADPEGVGHTALESVSCKGRRGEGENRGTPSPANMAVLRHTTKQGVGPRVIFTGGGSLVFKDRAPQLVFDRILLRELLLGPSKRRHQVLLTSEASHLDGRAPSSGFLLPV